jgi:isocitrate dehydrogenase
MTPSASPTITIARGDGIGPEIMDATLAVLQAAGADLITEEIQIGEAVYKAGHTSGIPPEAWNSIRKNRVMLKSPITTPLGGGYKSLNVTLRKTLGLYANLRPCQSFHPYVPTYHPDMNVLIVRENEEDTYAGIEHRQTEEVTQCLKLITRPGCEKIIRFAFETARQHGRKKVTCMTKNNIMKITDGLFQQVFREIAAEYPEFETEHQIIDIGSARMATRPRNYDVVVTPNLYGDILSDIAAEVAGSVGLAGSANLGADVAMFEAIHGSAPDIAGQNIANPSALLRAAVMMLVHLGQAETANTIENAWLCTLEAGIHTADMISPETKTRVGTDAFAKAVIERLGQTPAALPPAHFKPAPPPAAVKPSGIPMQKAKKELCGIDIFLDWEGETRDPAILGPALEETVRAPLTLKMITNRGVKVYPDGLPETFCTDHWRCRFVPAGKETPTPQDLLQLQLSLTTRGFDIVKTENLYTFDGVKGYSLGQGE